MPVNKGADRLPKRQRALRRTEGSFCSHYKKERVCGRNWSFRRNLISSTSLYFQLLSSNCLGDSLRLEIRRTPFASKRSLLRQWMLWADYCQPIYPTSKGLPDLLNSHLCIAPKVWGTFGGWKWSELRSHQSYRTIKADLTAHFDTNSVCFISDL